jgi:plasmid stabilization system protein ParE
VAIFRHFAREAGVRVADRFFAAAETTFARLAGMPGMGTQYEPEEAIFGDLRYLPISRFHMWTRLMWSESIP